MVDPKTIDSGMVLWGQTFLYTAYALAVLAVMAGFAYKITRSGKSTAVPPKLFFGWAALLVVVGVSLHLVTYNTIPWTSLDLFPGDTKIDRTFEITVSDHEFKLPSDQLEIACGDVVEFQVTSDDLTYGFGLFRKDNSMVFQMQVLPNRSNDILWRFEKNGVYSIRSTEYSGPKGAHMVVPDSVVVTGCSAG